MNDDATLIVDKDAIKSAVVAVGGNSVLGPMFGVTPAGVSHWIRHGMPAHVARYVHNKTSVPLAVLSPRHYDESFKRPRRKSSHQAA